MSDVTTGGPVRLQIESQLTAQAETDLASPLSEGSIETEDLEFENEQGHRSSPSESSTMSAPSRHNQPSGDRLQAIPKQKLVESGASYTTFLHELQIKPDRHDEVVNGILKPLRSKRMKNLRTATDAMMKDLSYAFIRGYGRILFKNERKKWLVPDIQFQQSGRQPLQFTPGRYEMTGPNAHLYDILEPMWWHMRSVVFQLKPPPRIDRLSPKETTSSLHPNDPNDTDVCHEDNELDKESKTKKTVAPHRHARPSEAADLSRFEGIQEETLQKIDQAINLSKGNGSWNPNYRMTAEEADKAICDLIARLHQIRCQSHPDAFNRSWEMNLARLDEIEDINGLRTRDSSRPPQQQPASASSNVAVLKAPQQTREVEDGDKILSASQEDTSVQCATKQSGFTHSNLANEPFNSYGPPSALNQLGISQRPLIPSNMSIYITTDPPLNPYKDCSYHWPDGPISLNDCDRFFNGIDQRCNVRNIQAYVLSYGWNDVMRSIKNDKGGRQRGFAVLQQDIIGAAKKGVTTWRLKALVFGEAPGYQGPA